MFLYRFFFPHIFFALFSGRLPPFARSWLGLYLHVIISVTEVASVIMWIPPQPTESVVYGGWKEEKKKKR